MPRVLCGLALLYGAASLGHFWHNAEFICEYPNLPQSFTRGRIYLAWLGITSIGVAGAWLLLLNARWRTAGLALLAVYAAFGFDGLGHYALAPMAWHPLAANVTILLEVAAAALLLAATGYAWLRHVAQGATLR